MNNRYCPSLVAYHRRQTIQTKIGDLTLGSDSPIRIQSMTTIDTMDTEGSITQSIRMIESGCELVRITAPSVKEAQNLENIRKGLRAAGYTTPLVADIHFTPNAAELAARIVEKVRINPGNYADKKRFELVDYSEAAYEAELERIRERLLPLIKICKEYGTALRIGTNHGSLSDRIMSRYGDSPLGMVESALEFLKICEDENYYNIVISMKSSNPQVMVQAYRLLVHRLDTDGLKPYPLHLGVTEAGEGEDGRIKSAMGIGTLLEDGLGDTVRVSLTEDPEFEAPVAKALIDRYVHRSTEATPIPSYSIEAEQLIHPFSYQRRTSKEVENIGHLNVPRVVADYSQQPIISPEDLKPIGHFYMSLTDKWAMNDLGADYIYTAQQDVPFMLPNGLKQIADYDIWLQLPDRNRAFPLVEQHQLGAETLHPTLNFVRFSADNLPDDDLLGQLASLPAVLVIHTSNAHAMPALRRLVVHLLEKNCHLPIIIERGYQDLKESTWQLYASTDVGGLLVDGMGDGVLLRIQPQNDETQWQTKASAANSLAFGILQAARTRMTKTEYISCPSCGRTLFDLQETTAMIRKRTDHLKGVKIGIMGCIVNGPGEMADADYGYVGMGKNKIALYRGQEVIKRSVNAEHAVDALIELIKEDGRWREPEMV